MSCSMPPASSTASACAGSRRRRACAGRSRCTALAVAQAADCAGAAAPRADAVVSALPGVPVGVVTADCVPILVATDDRHRGGRDPRRLARARLRRGGGRDRGAARRVGERAAAGGGDRSAHRRMLLRGGRAGAGGSGAGFRRGSRGGAPPRRGRVTPGSTSAGSPARRCCAPGSRRARSARCRAHARAAIRCASTPTAARAHPPAVSTISSRRAGPRLDTQGGGVLAFSRSIRLRSGFPVSRRPLPLGQPDRRSSAPPGARGSMSQIELSEVFREGGFRARFGSTSGSDQPNEGRQSRPQPAPGLPIHAAATGSRARRRDRGGVPGRPRRRVAPGLPGSVVRSHTTSTHHQRKEKIS